MPKKVWNYAELNDLVLGIYVIDDDQGIDDLDIFEDGLIELMNKLPKKDQNEFFNATKQLIAQAGFLDEEEEGIDEDEIHEREIINHELLQSVVSELSEYMIEK